MNDADALQHDLPEDEPAALLRLPLELLHEIAIWAPLRTFGQVTRLDARRVACIRLQRWYRSIERRDATMQLSVGDRVLVKPRAARQRMEYATAAAKVDDGRSWKVRMLDDVYLTIPTSQIRRLAEWVDGPWASSVGRSAALASASRARGAAMHAAAMAAQALRAGAPSSQTALVIAAASTASMAAAAATAASSAVAPIAANAFANTQEAHELLMATQQMQDAITDVGIAGGGLERARVLAPAAAPCDRSSGTLMAQAASAAAEAAREASAATSAALAVDSIGSLTVTASAVSRAASAAQQVVSAVEALEGALDASGAAAVSAVEIAAEALTDVRAAGRALTNSYSLDASDGGGASASTAHALDAAQAAAQVLRAAVPPSDVAKLIQSSRLYADCQDCTEAAPAQCTPAKPRLPVKYGQRTSPHVLPRSFLLRFQSSHLEQGLPLGGILYQPLWCCQNVLRLWEVLSAAGHDMSRFVVIHLTLPAFVFGTQEHFPSRFVRSGHLHCSSHCCPFQTGCCAFGGPEPATFSLGHGSVFVPTECKPKFTYHVVLATIDGLIYDLDQGDLLWGAPFEEWLQHIALVEHPNGHVEQVATWGVTFKILEHPMHRRNPALNGEYQWRQEVEHQLHASGPFCAAAMHVALLTFRVPPVVMNCVPRRAAQSQIDGAAGWPMEQNLYHLDINLDMSGPFIACEFRHKLAMVLPWRMLATCARSSARDSVV